LSEDAPLVYIVDDDTAVRDSLGLLMKSVGLACETHESATDFLESYDASRPSCLVADIRMPGMSGLELQQELQSRCSEIPILFITGHGDVPMAVNAMKNGAMDFIQKPFRDQDLLDRIHRALHSDQDRRASSEETAEIRERIDKLTPREKEVMEMVIQGHANKVIALDLGVSQRTVELHRARVMHKMGVRSLADLVRIAGRVDQVNGD
jgi:two-component system response regulator FixJ